MTNYEVFGWIATLCFALCYLPQLVRTFRRKEVGDISIWQWWIQLFGYVTGMVYGLSLKEGPLIFGYFWGFLCTTIFLGLYIRYARKKKRRNR